MGKIKFKLSVKELSFEFEGDQETGQRFQNSISKTLNSLTETPNHVIDIEAKTVADEAKLLSDNSTNGSVKKRKRRAKKTNDAVIDENGNEVKPKRHSRPSGQSCYALTRGLITENYFAENRTTANVREELAKKGHHFESNHISSVLLQLTKSEELKRDKNAEDVWIYTSNN